LFAVFDREERLRALEFEDYEPRLRRLLRAHYGPRGDCLETGRAPAAIETALAAFFAGEVTRIDALEVRTDGTEFQQAVWAALRAIPAGGTTSYGELARAIGRPGASRAVGRANGSNPIVIVVPCHRVIGANGTLTGYGGGLPRKQWLLEHEQRWRHAA
jgi:methylated-DNA-[protein]-cysteine S-methyltransferase